MIKFFRRIRQKLLSEGKTEKYLKYAIGEVVLVMIGILLALQVNEWNSERNRKKSEQVIIEQLITDLSKSQYELEDIINSNLRQAREYSRVLRAFWKTELPDNIEDQIRGRAGSTVYSPVMGTVNSLINSGRLDIISTKELKNDIVSYAEGVGYTLKDINRYEETYFRTGSALLVESIPGHFRSKEVINQQSKSSRWRWDYKYNLNASPEFIEKVPFKTDLKKLFEDQSYFSANQKLHLYHRNISVRYNILLGRTNELLVKLYLASDKYKALGSKLSESSYYLVFDTEDLDILKRVDALLSDTSKWNKNDINNCDNDRAMGKFSLECALKTATQDVIGEWENDPYRPAIRLIILKLLDDENRRYVRGVITDWNNHPDTSFVEVKKLLKDCIELIQKQLK